MELKQISKWFFISGSLAIKFIIRPIFLFDYPGRFFLNIAPNLLGSFLIPFVAYCFFSGSKLSTPRVLKIESTNDLRLLCLLSFGMLIVNEYLQLIPFFGRTFDYNDIIFSSVGLLVAYFTFTKLQSRKKPEYKGLPAR